MLNLWDPSSGFSRLSDASFVARTRVDTFMPAVDVFEDKEAFVVKAELAGVKAEDVAMDVENGVLTLHGERKREKRADKQAYCSIESSYGSFARSFILPDTVDPEKIEASLSEGILTVCLSKKASSQPRKIDIKVS